MDATSDRIDALRGQTISGLVRDEILRMITTGEVLAGQRLNELALASRLQVSRAPIREAFRALEEAGLLRLEKNRGVFVREPDAVETAELYELRAGLSEMAGRALARRVDASTLREIEERIALLERAAGPTEYYLGNIALHDRLVELTGNTTLLNLYRRIVDRTHLMRRRSFAGGTDPSQAEHRAILRALAGRDAEATGRLMRDHVEQGYQRMLAEQAC